MSIIREPRITTQSNNFSNSLPVSKAYLRFSVEHNIISHLFGSMVATFENSERFKIIFHQTLSEMVFTKSTDNFLAFLSELIGEICQKNINILKSFDTKIDIGTILEHNNMQELLNSITDKIINDLSYKGAQELTMHLNNKLKFQLFLNENDEKTIVRIIESRNIIVHNRGKVNTKFIKNVGSSKLKLNESVIESINISEDIQFLQDVAFDINNRALKKFNLTEWSSPNNDSPKAKN